MHRLEPLDIIYRTFDFVKKQPMLWLLGLLTGFIQLPNISGSLPDEVVRKIGRSISFDWLSQSFLTSRPMLPFFIALVIGVILAVIYITVTAQAGLVIAADRLDRGEKVNYLTAFHDGRGYFWRLVGLSLFLMLIVFAGIVPFIVAIIVTVATKVVVAKVMLILFLVLAGLAFLVFIFYLGLVAQLAARAIVLEGLGVFQALRESRNIVHRNLSQSLVVLGVALAIQMLIGMAMLAAAGLLGVGALSVATLGSALTASFALPFIVIVVLLFLAILLIIGGITAAFESVYWTLSYRALRFIDRQGRSNNK